MRIRVEAFGATEFRGFKVPVPWVQGLRGFGVQSKGLLEIAEKQKRADSTSVYVVLLSLKPETGNPHNTFNMLRLSSEDLAQPSKKQDAAACKLHAWRLVKMKRPLETQGYIGIVSVFSKSVYGILHGFASANSHHVVANCLANSKRCCRKVLYQQGQCKIST